MQVSTSSNVPCSSSLDHSRQMPQEEKLQTLHILLSSDHWGSIIFTRSDDLSRKVSEFILVHRLSPLVEAGLVSQLRQMVMMRQLSASVDIVDILCAPERGIAPISVLV